MMNARINVKDGLILLVPQFVDRAGRTVYNVHRRAGGRYHRPGALIGQTRLRVLEDETCAFEWLIDNDE